MGKLLLPKDDDIYRAELVMGNYKQLNLGDLIYLLELAGEHDSEGGQKQVEFDFPSMTPKGFSSYRGLYTDLAIGYKDYELTKYGKDADELLEQAKAGNFIKELKATIGKQFTGYKGGEYTMNPRTPLWIANYGKSTGIAPYGVYVESHWITILTGLED